MTMKKESESLFIGNVKGDATGVEVSLKKSQPAHGGGRIRPSQSRRYQVEILNSFP